MSDKRRKPRLSGCDDCLLLAVEILLENEYGAALNVIREDYPELAAVFDSHRARTPAPPHRKEKDERRSEGTD